ncbi:hypothetical protein HNY73_012750 [Argiope bruennichi]|uniref:Uncharacterized protein n=1 Tax=Argiope bruennichi TaxID=94029 RepID=A0A8T0F0N9_ARGBR|nr:hypothetical protein HNY73_012750 [Argiope bruennichi]
MTASGEDSRIVKPLKPSLSHMCLSKVAFLLYNEFGYKILKKRVQEKLLLIPTNLRKVVLEGVKRVQQEIRRWIVRHEKKDQYCYYPKCTIFWRSDGTIDRLKTAQEIVRNENIDITARFEIACMYSLVNSVQTLWSALEANGEADQFKKPCTDRHCNVIVHIWVSWLLQEERSDWTEAVHQDLSLAGFQYFVKPRFSALFRELKPAQRSKFFKYLKFCDADDLRFCLYAVSAKEQKEIMKLFAREVLLAHAKWPLTDAFLEIADKSWEFLNPLSFTDVLGRLLEFKNCSDVDYKYLVEEFWNRSPAHFKEDSFTFVERKTNPISRSL